MNNIELEQKIKEILAVENYFDAVQMALDFNNEYKTSDFYKATKKPLMEIIKEAKVFYALQFKDIGVKVQKLINGLDLSKLNGLFDQMAAVFETENAEVQEQLLQAKDIFEELKG